MKKLIILLAFLLIVPSAFAATLVQNNKITPKLATLISNDGVKKQVVVGSSEAEFYLAKLDWHLQTNLLGGTGVINQTPALFETSLAAPIGKSDTSMVLVTGVDKSGLALSGNYCFTIDGGLSIAEYVCGTATGASITSMTRGIGANGVSTIAALTSTHRYGADVKITDFPVLQQMGRILNGTDTFPNVLSYSSSATSSFITAANQIPNKAYVDSVAISGASNGSNTVNGIWQGATQAQMSIGTKTGSTGANLVLQSQYASSTSGISDVVVANGSGKIDPSFLNGTEAYTFNGANTFAATTTFSSAATFNSTTNLPLEKVYYVNSYTLAATTTLATVFSQSISANSLSSGGMIKITFPATFDIGDFNGSNTMTIKLNLGGSTISTLTLAGPQCTGGCVDTPAKGQLIALINNTGATNTQNVSLYAAISPAATSMTSSNTFVIPNSNFTTSAIDMTQAQTLSLTLQNSYAKNGTITLGPGSIEVIH